MTISIGLCAGFAIAGVFVLLAAFDAARRNAEARGFTRGANARGE